MKARELTVGCQTCKKPTTDLYVCPECQKAKCAEHYSSSVVCLECIYGDL